MIAARLQAYAPNGVLLGEMPYPLTVDPMVAHNDVGSLAFSYSDLTVGGAHLATALQSGLEVALELSKGEKDSLGRDLWVEPKGCRFVRLEDDTDPSDPTKRVSLTLPSFGWLLSKCVVGAEGAVDGRRVFTAPTVGEILLALLDENGARDGYATSIVPTFTETTDSAGTSWPVLPDQGFEIGADYLTVLDGLTAAGACDWTTQARGLYLYVPDSATLSPDLSDDDGVVLSLGTDVAGAPTKRSIANMSGRVLVLAEAGGVTMAEEPTATTGWGIPESTLRIGQVAGESAAIAVGQAELERVGRPQGQFTRELILAAASDVPLLDYWPGCWIMAPGAAGAGEKLRVQQATLAFKGLESTGSLTLNDLLLEADERRARTLASLAGGTISPGGPAAPISVDPEASRIPSTPTGLIRSAALTFTGPTPRGIVTASWTAVTTATDSGTLAISGYELQWRIGAGAWQTIVTPEVSAQIQDLTPGDSVTVRVRAVGARTTLPSAYATATAITVPGDVTAPSVPNAPVVSSRLGVVAVAWDGGPTMPEDFDRVEIALGSTTTPTTVRQTLKRAGVALITGEAYGETRYARLRSVDTSGNASAWSTVSDAVLVVAVQGPDLEANSVTTNALAAGVVDAEKLNSVISISGLFTTSEDGTGQRVEWDPAGIRLIKADETLKINFPTADGEDPTVRARIQADGLTVYEGATFYSTLNEFARDSEISLAEQVAGPLAGPVPTMTWSGTTLQKVSKTGTLGTFALVPSEVIGIGQDYQVNTRFYVLQKRSNGTRIWTYNFAGALTSTEFWDLADFEVTGFARGASGEAKYLGKWAANGEWYLFDGDVSTSQYSRYPSANPSTRNTMAYNGTDILVGEKISTTGYRLRRMSVPAGGADATVLENVNSTGIGALTPALAFIFKGAADFGSTKWVISHQDVNSFRVFSSAGAFDSTLGWNPPVQKAGGLWNPSDSLFYTLGSDGVLYKHTSMTWTDPVLDTWHVGQSFYDSNATGGTHETGLGTITSFTMMKRARVRFSLADVPYAGGTDDPNEWRLYAKRGAAPLTNLSDMKLQSSGAYTVKTHLMTAAPTTGGSAALQFGTFPNASPAKLYSGRVSGSDPTKHIFEVRGDGSGHWGPFEFASGGTVTDSRDTDWLPLTLVAGRTNVVNFPAQYCRRGGSVYLRGRVSGVAGASPRSIGTLPAGFWPDPGQGSHELGTFASNGAVTEIARVFVSDVGLVSCSLNPTGMTTVFLGGSFPLPLTSL